MTQLLSTEKQNMPVAVVQSVDPHLHKFALAAEPTVLEQSEYSQPLAGEPSMSYFPASHEQHWSLLSVHQVQIVLVGFADCVEEEQVTASPAVLFLPQFPQVESKLQVSVNMLEPGYAELPPALEIQVRSSFDLKLNAFAP